MTGTLWLPKKEGKNERERERERNEMGEREREERDGVVLSSLSG
jgi:hypothetical protein